MLQIRRRHLGKKRTIHERLVARRLAVRTFIAVVALFLMIIAAGLLYVWYMGRYPAKTPQSVKTPSSVPSIKPYVPPEDATVGIAQQSFSGTVKLGSTASIGVKTNPKAVCQIQVKVSNQLLPDNGLIPKTADEYGLVDWSWSVPKTYPTGTWPVEITCANTSKHSAFYRAYLEVK